MSSLRSAAPRPSTARVAPAYPRLLAIGVLVLAGCGGAIDNQETASGTPGPTGTTQLPPSSGGGSAAPFDAGPPDTGPADTGAPDAGDSGADALPFPEPAGDIASPFDAGAGDV